MKNRILVIYFILVCLILLKCKDNNSFSKTLISSKWQHFSGENLSNEDGINLFYIVFDNKKNIKTYLIDSNDSPFTSGSKWKYNKSDSIFDFGNIKFKIIKIDYDTIYMLNERNEINYLIKYNTLSNAPDSADL